jgi:hypothetical protein
MFRMGFFGGARPKLEWGILAVEICQMRNKCHYGSDEVERRSVMIITVYYSVSTWIVYPYFS